MKLVALAAAALAFSGTAIAQTPPEQPQDRQPAPGDPNGGYAPAGPLYNRTPLPGDRVVVQPSPTPDEAYPAPQPPAYYPLCRPHQYDHCRQRGG